jgi:hypothetical protein
MAGTALRNTHRLSQKTPYSLRTSLCSLRKKEKRKTSFQNNVSPPSKREKGTARLSDKCLEATQLKTVRTVRRGLRIDPAGVEIQVAGMGA